MSTLLLYVRTAWIDYYPGTTPNRTNSQTYTSRQVFSGTYVCVSNCLFKSITATSEGGAMYCSSVTNLLVESTSFFSCTTTSSGGAIYLVNGNAQCVLYVVCGYECCSTTSGNSQFAYIVINNAVSSKNYVNYSSISRSMSEVSGSYQPLRLSNGKICCPSVNLSMNKCHYRSAIYCEPYSDSNSVTCSLTYSTFADNNATGYTCIRFGTSSAQYEMKSCNIIRNTQVTLNTEGTIRSNGNLMIEDSCILENTATYMFYASSSYTITLSKCSVDKTTSTGSFKLQNTLTKSFILALKHMSTQNCHAEYDSNGCPTPIIQLCYTFKNFFLQPRLRDVVSLTSILFFNFIHPYALNDPSY